MWRCDRYSFGRIIEEVCKHSVVEGEEAAALAQRLEVSFAGAAVFEHREVRDGDTSLLPPGS